MDAIDPNKLWIRMYPDSILRRQAQPIDRATDQVRQVATSMLELMHETHGVGLAAPQVGLAWRMFVANPTGEPGGDDVFINPVLSRPSRRAEQHEEGCLSLPEIRGMIQRSWSITIDAIGLDGHVIRRNGDDLAARVWQHETDHLEGVLIIDRMSRADVFANRQHLRDLDATAKR